MTESSEEPGDAESRRTEAPAEEAEQETLVDAPALSRLILVLVPFLIAVAVFLAIRSVG